MTAAPPLYVRNGSTVQEMPQINARLRRRWQSHDDPEKVLKLQSRASPPIDRQSRGKDHC
jgi:hypothetical protein